MYMASYNMGIEIKIDTREPALQALLQTYHHNTDTTKQADITICIEPLDIGDVHIISGNQTIMIERKTCTDLAASIKDNRYKEQKMRLLASGTKPRHIIYVLEGVPTQHSLLSSDFPIHGLKPSVLSGMMVYTMLRDGIHVLPVHNTQETAAWIWTITLKSLANPEKIFGGTEQGHPDEGTNTNTSSYLHSVKVKKIDNVTPYNCYIMQLCQIPNISVTTATEIVKKYPTMYALLSALSGSTDYESRVKLLTDIPMIGKKKAQVVVSYLLTEEQKTA